MLNMQYLLHFSETGAEPSLQATQMRLKRARLADNLNEKIAQRPGPMELVEKNILPVDSTLKQAIIGENQMLLQRLCPKGCHKKGIRWNLKAIWERNCDNSCVSLPMMTWLSYSWAGELLQGVG